MSIDIEQQQKTLETKIRALESQIASSQKELKQLKDQLSALIKIANRGKIT